MKQLKPTNLIAVEVPEDAINSRFYIEGTLFVDTPDKRAIIVDNFSGGNYSILGEVTKEGIQFDVEPYLEKYQQTLGWRADGNNKLLNTITLYKNYAIKNPVPVTFLKTAPQESFNSLLQANNVEIPEGNKLLILLKQ